MPELPEVEVICRALRPHLTGQRVRGIRVWTRRLRHPVPTLRMRDLIVGRCILDVRRRGKYILVEFERGTLLVLHLGMTGAFRIVSRHEPRLRSDRVEWWIGDSLGWRLADVRRFSQVSVETTGAGSDAPTTIARLGPEPLEDEFNVAFFGRLAAGRTVPVKNLLMNQAAVAGIGNIYASEALFAAGIDPRRASGDLSREECGRVVAAVKVTLEAAIAAGGTTLRDFRLPDGTEGGFQRRLDVYGRAGRPCPRCGDGCGIVRILQAGRSTFLCPRCQR
ncbi:MAG: bifunctional DNA-formamidopyrimidine glycosylase/DNA-(apurinic or apyrimidinic site) lyase [Kiritimatiellaeota bacterium]|nr:bifunctional DNA-formamidopyrimidine glycosylase/DNA-(apurinic or apyrimidinic site) lyase [Kiritimatiellota bacterium]